MTNNISLFDKVNVISITGSRKDPEACLTFKNIFKKMTGIYITNLELEGRLDCENVMMNTLLKMFIYDQLIF